MKERTIEFYAQFISGKTLLGTAFLWGRGNLRHIFPYHVPVELNLFRTMPCKQYCTKQQLPRKSYLVKVSTKDPAAALSSS